MKHIMTFFLILAAVYTIALICLYIFQRYMIYVPDHSQAFPVLEKRVITTQTDDGLRLTSFFSLPKIDKKTVVVMFHGNAGHAGGRQDKIAPFIKAGYGAVVMGYRGYGGNSGKPSEQDFYEDAKRLIETLIEKGHSPENMILYGESLGTGVASKMATLYPVKGVIFEAPFISLVEAARGHYPIFPVKALIKDRFDTEARINQIKAPILFMHGMKDTIIPVFHSQYLYKMYQGSKELKIFENGNHNNLIDYGAGQVSLDFIERLDQ